MALQRNAGLNVVITGDTRGLERATFGARRDLDKFGKEAEQHSSRVSKGFAGVGVAARGMAIGVGAAVLVGDKLVSAFSESNKVAKQTEAVLKSTGGAAGVTAKQVGDLATAISRKTGIDDEAIQSGENLLLTFTNIHNETGRGNRIFSQATRTIADMSVALGQDTKSSAIQLGKALNDPIRGVTALQRVGVSFTQQQREQIKALVDSGRAMDAQKMILRELNKEFGGSAAAQATPFDRLKVSVGNLAEQLGSYLAPAFSKAASAANDFLIGLEDGTGAGGKFGRAVKTAASALSDAWGAASAEFREFIERNRADLETIGRAFQTVIRKVIIPTVRILAPAVRATLRGIRDALDGLIKFIAGVLSGDWAKAWDGLKKTVSGTVRGIVSLMQGLDNVLGSAAKAAGKAVVRGILAGMGQLGHLITKKITDSLGFAANALSNPGGIPGTIGKAIGKAIGGGIGDGPGFSIGTPGLGGGALMGADADLAPFASLGAQMGLRTSSGLRPGAHTISGGLSYHATGDAIDEFGPMGRMRQYTSTLYHRFGGRLRELISPFPEFGIKDGRPFRYSGAIQAQHSGSNAHVHVAYTGPFGDGIGDMRGLWLQAGGRKGAAAMAAAIAMAESGGRRYPPSPVNSDGSIDRGPWQINSVHGGLSTTNPLGNARAAVKISHNGRDWSPWTTFQSGAYRRFLKAARGGGGSRGGSTGAGLGALVGGGGFGANAGPLASGNPVISTGFGAGVGMFTPDPDFSLPTQLDYLNAASAQAALTPRTADDLAAAQNTQGYYQGVYNQALGTGDPRIIGPAAEALKAATDAVTALTESIDAANRIAEERAQVEKEVRDNQRTLIQLTKTQGPQLVAGLTAILSGGIGGRVALGFQTPGYSGGGVRY